MVLIPALCLSVPFEVLYGYPFREVTFDLSLDHCARILLFRGEGPLETVLATFGIIPESDSEGRAVCQFWLQGGKHNVTPTDKITFKRESPWGPLDPPPLLGRKETTKFPKRTA